MILIEVSFCPGLKTNLDFFKTKFFHRIASKVSDKDRLFPFQKLWKFSLYSHYFKVILFGHN